LQRTELFKPPLHLRNAHLQTVLNSQGPRKLRANRIQNRLATESLILQASDGTRLLADLDHAASPQSSLAVLIHGWEGSSRSSYLVTTAERLLARGYDVLRLNLRDHGDSHHLNRELFNSTRSPEVASALQGFVDAHTYERRFIVGFSLGASFALRVAADSGPGLGLDAAIGVCPPTDPARVMHALNHGFFAYERYFFRKWHGSLQRKLELFPEFDYGEALASARSLDDLNRIFVPQHTIYREVDDYFAAYALIGDRLAELEVPAWIIASEDDPIIPVDDLDRINPIETLNIEIQRYGGHCGFIQSLSAHSWIEQRIVELFDSCR